MKKRIVIIVVSMMVAMVFMSGGYGYWQRQLTITGGIEVKEEPVAKVVVPQGMLSTGGGGGGGVIAIPNVPVDPITGIETTAPINQNEPQIDGNSRGGAPQGETTKGIDNPGQQQSTDSQGETIGDTGGSVTVDSSPTPEPSTPESGSTPNDSAWDSGSTTDTGTSDSGSSADGSSSSSNSGGDKTSESTDSDL